MMQAKEYNFDGIVGATHNYAGLSHGNLASTKNKLSVSNPRAAALEGLAKMRMLHEMGVPQAVLPPQERPHVPTLRRLGFSGSSDGQVIEKAYKNNPVLLAACSSASAMWTANAATVSPSADCADGRTHFTPANLCGLLHRSIETATTGRVLRAIFSDESAFAHHEALPATSAFGDEGAANHSRLCSSHSQVGLELFVYGRSTADVAAAPTRFPARQTLEASQAIARLHGLQPERTIYLQQNPAAIDAGAFHNDVVAVGYRDVFFYHELAFVESLDGILDLFGREKHLIRVPASAVSLEDAIASYLFNSQLVGDASGRIVLIAPAECGEIESVGNYLASPPAGIDEVRFVDVRQSMRNGGGPACLRLRVVLRDTERAKVQANVFYDDLLHARLEAWVRKHYREELAAKDLADPQLLLEGRAALDELTGILGVGSVYDFQRQSGLKTKSLNHR